jgi:succinate dehydrogenase/fumarate reductase flavoprotein subunit
MQNPEQLYAADLTDCRDQKGEITMAKEKLVVIGGDAAGMSAVSQAKRRQPELKIVVFERGPHTSFSA